MQVEIKIKGKLNNDWVDWFENMKIIQEGEDTILYGFVADQSALHGILNKIRDLNLKLISVNSDKEENNK